jgi:formylglycine-generating enzyme required for sulfatase activity
MPVPSASAARRPVETVSWAAASAFCDRAALKLPTEAQWEYACRAGSATAFSCGELLPATRARAGGGWSVEDDGTVEVHAYPPNDFGIHQMHGNVPEWCEDAFDWEFYSKPDATRPDSVCREGHERVLRGGSWQSPPRDCRSASRSAGDPESTALVVGVRPAFWPLP